MKTYDGNDLNFLYLEALSDSLKISSPNSSRSGIVYDLGPAVFQLPSDKLNLITLNRRALNPFFAIAEAAWVIGGFNDLAYLDYYIKTYGDFSDDGKTLNGAYGYRLRQQYGFDQIDFAIEELKTNPQSRRCVLSMYSPSDLINTKSKDIPCNTSVMLKIRNGELDLTVINRSNDIYWGVPYNFFVFQVLHYYMASRIDIKVGTQRHFTDSLHLYEKDLSNIKSIINNNNAGVTLTQSMNIELIDGILNNIAAINQRNFTDITNTHVNRLLSNYSKYKSEGDLFALNETTNNTTLDFLVSDWSRKYIGNSIC
ncbi:thymidylate synthase [Enterobacter cloacae]|uniref:thymidylate synthase n=3 Tax=Enterobacter TaxID=547 RepID=UPI00073512DF|nr:thymidylate synthase [Enterobacter cloacae]EKM5716331.1 thymidylate synthase [Enterobacter cloacae]EKP1123512.1 thymidylate synthase [Enterobacter cloacae]EKU2768226.1 thymidylate synthase [Enterobacter cloacae]EKV7705613.1 thymidylate synthase [Enterobacter cloacae]ELQ9030256.1 thymidylate synthase [Enterobacter cloacae]